MTEENKKLIVGVTRETFPDENRVAVVADLVPLFSKADMQIVIESGAGLGAGLTDERYRGKGADVVPDRKTVFDKEQA